MATFTVENPEIDFEIIDGGFSSEFDGKGDEVFNTFNSIVLGTVGEAASFVEFDISDFSLPPGESITSATFQFSITSLELGGLGVNFGENPDLLGIYGYPGNGIAELSDFEAENLLEIIDISSVQVGDFVTFDITNFVQELVNNGDSFVGLGVRAQVFGGLAIEESSIYQKSSIFPKLKITTEKALQITGTSKNDTLIGAGANDTLRGRNGNDVLSGLTGDDLLFGDKNRDNLLGGADFDTLFGGDGNDSLDGGDGLDTLFGGDGNDSLNGGDDLDILFGDDGNDSLDGGEGINSLEGGKGADRFVLQFGPNNTITDFENGKDLLVLTGGLNFERLTINEAFTPTSSTGIYLKETFELLAILEGVSVSSVGAEDFIVG